MDTKNIMGSKWSAVVVIDKKKHFEVVSYNNKEKSVYLKPVLKGKSRLVSLTDLENKEKWLPGWL